MTDMERVWAYGRIIRQIWDVGQEIKARLARYERHCIMFVPSEASAEDLADIERRRQKQ